MREVMIRQWGGARSGDPTGLRESLRILFFPGLSQLLLTTVTTG
jgi:hypothetical protein